MKNLRASLGLSAAAVGCCALLLGVAAPRSAQDAPPGDPTGGAPGQAPSTALSTPPLMNWPQTTQKDGVTYTIDRPTFGSLLGTQIRLEAPLQVTTADGSQQSGQVEISATIAPADQHGEVEINRFEVIKATIGGADDTGPVRTALNTLLQNAGLTVDRRALAAKLQVDPVSTPGLKHQPPVIKVVERPTVLLSVDGDPRTVPMGTTGWRRATNTPFILIVDPNSNWYLRLGQNDWRGAYSFRGPWQKASPPPDAVIAALGKPPALPPDVARDQAVAEQSRAATQNTQTQPPDVLVATVPTVLISLNGPAQLAPVCPGVQGATNTDGILLFTDNQATGRWLRAGGSLRQQKMARGGTSRPRRCQRRSRSCHRQASTNQRLPACPTRQQPRRRCWPPRDAHRDAGPLCRQVRGEPTRASPSSRLLTARVPAVRGERFAASHSGWHHVLLLRQRSVVSSSAPDSGWTLCDKVPDDIYNIPAKLAYLFVHLRGGGWQHHRQRDLWLHAGVPGHLHAGRHAGVRHGLRVSVCRPGQRRHAAGVPADVCRRSWL
ncbi:MAG: hypothetical protein U0636_03475 [Phycisphaerales bacterium]